MESQIVAKQKPRVQAAWLSYDDVAAELAVSKNTVVNYVRQGILPKPKQIGPRIVRFSRHALEAWLSTIAEKHTEEAIHG